MVEIFVSRVTLLLEMDKILVFAASTPVPETTRTSIPTVNEEASLTGKTACPDAGVPVTDKPVTVSIVPSEIIPVYLGPSTAFDANSCQPASRRSFLAVASVIVQSNWNSNCSGVIATRGKGYSIK